MSSATHGRNAKASKELQTALQDDSRRQAIDVAKKKAVGQHVDYDTFKNMVAVAHLRPLQDAKLAQSVSAAPAWTFAPDGQQVKAAAAPNLRVQAFDVRTCPIPVSGDLFLRVWKHQCTTSESRVELLRKCGAFKLQSIFKANLPGELLSDILIVLDSMPVTAEDAMQDQKASQGHADSQQLLAEAHGMRSGEVNLIFDIMKALCGTGRFALTVRLISLAAKKAAEGLFLKLQQVSGKGFDSTELYQLQCAFGVHHLPSEELLGDKVPRTEIPS